MRTLQPQVVVAGHICLDMIPVFPKNQRASALELTPGKLYLVGPAVLATGGAVSNTGQALHRLGIPATLMGKVGDDLFGQGILDLLRRQSAELAAGMRVAAGEKTSYSVVISPPHTDRLFLHCPGANDTFTADDVDERRLAGARLFHFGYPPLMQRMFARRGVELSRLFKKIKALGLTTSLDMAQPDPVSPAGRADWTAILRRTLPHVDVFLPSVEELLFMLARQTHAKMVKKHGHIRIAQDVTGELLSELSERLIEMGVAVVVIKLGDQGLYLRTTKDLQRLSRMGACAPTRPKCWLERELYIPCFQVKVAGTTGAGDCTIAGFLAAFLRGSCPVRCLKAGVAVGACNVEAADATSGVPSWNTVEARLAADWPSHPVRMKLDGWRKVPLKGLLAGPHDEHEAHHEPHAGGSCCR